MMYLLRMSKESTRRVRVSDGSSSLVHSGFMAVLKTPELLRRTL
jgi:hypothetical protein